MPFNSNTIASITKKTLESLRTQPVKVLFFFPIAVCTWTWGPFLLVKSVPIPIASQASLKATQFGSGGITGLFGPVTKSPFLSAPRNTNVAAFTRSFLAKASSSLIMISSSSNLSKNTLPIVPLVYFISGLFPWVFFHEFLNLLDIFQNQLGLAYPERKRIFIILGSLNHNNRISLVFAFFYHFLILSYFLYTGDELIFSEYPV